MSASVVSASGFVVVIAVGEERDHLREQLVERLVRGPAEVQQRVVHGALEDEEHVEQRAAVAAHDEGLVPGGRLEAVRSWSTTIVRPSAEIDLIVNLPLFDALPKPNEKNCIPTWKLRCRKLSPVSVRMKAFDGPRRRGSTGPRRCRRARWGRPGRAP